MVQPTAEGTLARTPLPHVLLYVRDRRLAGTLAVWPDEAGEDPAPNDAHPAPSRKEDRVLFEAGVPVAGRFATEASTLERGLLDLFQRERAPYAFYEAVDYVGGSAAVLRGHVNLDQLLCAGVVRGRPREDVIDAVLGKLGDGPIRLRPDAQLLRFGLLGTENAFVEVLRAAPAPVAQLVAGFANPKLARRLLYLFAITRSLEPVDPQRLAAVAQGAAAQRASAPPAPASQVSQAPAASAVSPERISLPVPPPPSTPAPSLPLPSLPPPGSAPGSAAGSAAGPTASQPPAARKKRGLAPPEPPPPPPPGLSAEHAALWNEISRRYVNSDRQTYYDMLGIGTDASAQRAKDAYFEAVKRLHPDRLPPELAPLAPQAQRVFALLTEAHDTLSDEARRLKYLSDVKSGGGTPEAARHAAAVLESTVEHSMAEALLKQRKYEQALAHVHAAIELYADECDYHVTEARILLEQHAEDDAILPRALAAVDRAVGLNPKRDLAHFWRGRVLGRLGRGREAYEAYKRARDLNPKNVDAEREVRIYEMRMRTGGGAERKGDGGKSEPPRGKGGGADRGAGKGGDKPAAKPGGLLGGLFGGLKKK